MTSGKSGLEFDISPVRSMSTIDGNNFCRGKSVCGHIQSGSQRLRSYSTLKRLRSLKGRTNSERPAHRTFFLRLLRGLHSGRRSDTAIRNVLLCSIPFFFFLLYITNRRWCCVLIHRIAVKETTTGEISRNVAEAAKGSSEIARNITGVAQAARSTTEGASNTKDSADGLSKMALELQQLVGQFKY